MVNRDKGKGGREVAVNRLDSFIWITIKEGLLWLTTMRIIYAGWSFGGHPWKEMETKALVQIDSFN